MADILLLAIRARLNHLAQPMTLTGTLPNATAGAAYTGTLTLGGTFTAPVAIDASTGSIPSWMTPSVAGNTVTFTGTAPASAETDTFTVRATDSSATPQVATAPQSVVVSAASSYPSVVQFVSAYNYAVPYTLSLGAPPAPGHQLVAIEHFRSGQTAAVTGFTQFKNVALTRGQLNILNKTSAGTEQTINITGSGNIIGAQCIEFSASSINAAVTHTPNAVAMTVNSSTHVGTGTVTPRSTAPNSNAIPVIVLTGADQGNILRVGTVAAITATNGWNVTCSNAASAQGDYSSVVLSRTDNTNPPFTLTIGDTTPVSLDMTEFWVQP